MRVLHLDFETRSAADLRKVGLDVYAADPSTDVLCAAYAFDNEPVKMWFPREELPFDVYQHIHTSGNVWAHNAAFEVAIAHHVLTERYDWPILSPTQMTCTMAMAYAMGLPGSLDGCAAALGVSERKDAAGSRIMLQLSKPRSVDADTGEITWWLDQEKLERLYAYCRQDVIVERAVGKRMLPLSKYERRVWALDWEINKRGICADVVAVENALALVESEKARLNDEMRAVTHGLVKTCTSVQQIKDFLQFFNVPAEELDKAAVGEYLAAPGLSPVARQVLELRAEAGKAATSKLTPMLISAGDDNRLRGCFAYSGANTRRWAGRRIQLHNLKRPTLKHAVISELIDKIGEGATAEEIAANYGAPMNVLGDCIRSFLIAAPGQELLVADFSAIEARVLAWLAGQANVLEVFLAGQDIYKVAASQIFGVHPELVSDDQRQVGKVAVLALGYGGGVGAFQTMAKGYGVKMAPAYDHLLHTATADQRLRAKEMWNLNQKKYEEIGEKEFIASELTKVFWRAANPRIVEYWGEVEAAALCAIENTGQIFGNSNVRFRKAGSFLWCSLPSGGVICYPYPEIREVTTPWKTKRLAPTYMSEDGQSREWKRFSTYGGSLVENITQAVARDLLADAMLRLDEKGFKIVAHVHDEIICEMPLGMAALQEMIAIMTKNPVWAEGLPLKAAGFTGRRYRK